MLNARMTSSVDTLNSEWSPGGKKYSVVEELKLGSSISILMITAVIISISIIRQIVMQPPKHV